MPVINTDPLANDKAVILWDNRFERSALTYEGDAADAPGINVFNDSTFDYARQAGTGSVLITKVGSGSGMRADALGISGHNLGTTGSNLFLRVSNDNVTYTNLFPSYSPVTDEDLFFIFPTYSSVYWKVAWGGSTNAYVSNVILGPRLDFPCTPVVGYTPVNHSWKYQKYFNNSIEGQLLGNRVRARGGVTTVSFPEIPRSFVDNELPGFEDHYARGRTFFYAGWPNGKPKDMGYCWASGENDAVNVTYTGGRKLATVNFGINIHGQ